MRFSDRVERLRKMCFWNDPRTDDEKAAGEVLGPYEVGRRIDLGFVSNLPDDEFMRDLRGLTERIMIGCACEAEPYIEFFESVLIQSKLDTKHINLCRDFELTFEGLLACRDLWGDALQGGHGSMKYRRQIIQMLGCVRRSLELLGTAHAYGEILPDAMRGRKNMRAVRAAHAAVYGTPEEKQARWAEFRKAYDDLRKRRPDLSKKRCYELVGKEFKVSAKTIYRHLKS